MKRMTALFLALLLLMACASAETVDPEPTPDATAPSLPVVLATGTRTQAESYEELIVGSTTPLSGQFFTSCFGNNTSDADVRDLIHGYALTYWDVARGAFTVDTSVVTSMTAAVNAAGDKVYTVTLADDLTYNDGSKITARDYVFTILLTASKAFAALGATEDSYNYLTGWAAYHESDAGAFAGVRLLAEDSFSVTVSKDALPYFYELSYLCVSPSPIDVLAPGCAVADDGDGAKIVNAKRQKKPLFNEALLKKTLLDAKKGYLSHPAKTCGPYTLEAYNAKTQVAAFTQNPHYKGDMTGKTPTIARLTFRHVGNDQAEAALRAGEIDLLNKCASPAAIEACMPLVAEDRARVANYLRVGLNMISFCCETGVASSQAVRQAVAYAFDKQAFAAEQIKNYGVAVDGYYGIGQWMVQLAQGTLQPPVAQPEDPNDAAAQAAYDEAVAQWSALSLDSLPKYALDLDKAAALLAADGWTQNETGGAFEPGQDTLRYREVEGQREPLSLTLYIPEGNAVAQAAAAMLTDNLAKLGCRLTVEPKPFQSLLNAYYRKEARACDMIYMATNFDTAYDPAATFSTAPGAQRVTNATGIQDERLYQLALALNQTESGDLLGYCQKWMALQTYLGESMPVLPLYSNIYFDYYTPRLQNYNIQNFGGWGQAVLYAYLGDPAETPATTPTPEPAEDGVVTILD